MKNTYLLSLFTITLLALSCSDPCDDIICNQGTCIDGTCDCDPGYSGTNCETNICDITDCFNGDCDPVTGACTCLEGYEGITCDTEIRAKYLGSYTGSIASCLEELGIGGILPDNFAILNGMITADPTNVNNVMMTAPNPIFMLGEVNTKAGDPFLIPVNTQSIDIPNIPFPVSITISGSGEFIDENTIEITLNIVTPLVVATCTVTLTKQ